MCRVWKAISAQHLVHGILLVAVMTDAVLYLSARHWVTPVMQDCWVVVGVELDVVWCGLSFDTPNCKPRYHFSELVYPKRKYLCPLPVHL